MIGWLKGRILDRIGGLLVIDVLGVGYEVHTTQAIISDYKAEVIELFIHTVVREDALLLYGFITRKELSLFKVLLKISGIGPKLALSILSHISHDELYLAVQKQNIKKLQEIPGVGKKMVERMLIELKGVLVDLALPESEIKLSMKSTSETEALSALETLGYKPQEALKAIKSLQIKDETSEEIIRRSLQVLARNKL